MTEPSIISPGHASSGKQVVLLIDEYDKPLIDNLTRLPQAVEIRNTLKNFYTVIKALDRYLRFVFITGISKFSKYRLTGKPMTLIGANFDSTTRKITEWQHELAA